MFALGAALIAGPGHDARSPQAWLKLGEHDPEYPDRYDGYLNVSQPIGMTFKRPEVRFDRARLISLNSIDRTIKEPEIEELPELKAPEPIEEVIETEIVIIEPEVVEIDDVPEPIVQEDINSMYNEAGMLNPDDILLYLRDFETDENGNPQREVGGAFRFQLPGNSLPVRGEATFEQSP